jgi:AcrR family transcriptional regulator
MGRECSAMGSKSLKDKKTFSIERILKAASDVFSEMGFSGARMDEIARRAGLNKAMIYYRIGDKKALYEAVLHNFFSAYAQRIVENTKAGNSPEEKFKIFVRNTVRTIDKGGGIAPIMMRELASGTRTLPEVVAQDFVVIISTLATILDEGEQTGVFVKTNPFFVHMMIVGTVSFYKMSLPVRIGMNQASGGLKKLNIDSSEDPGPILEDYLFKMLKN